MFHWIPHLIAYVLFQIVLPPPYISNSILQQLELREREYNELAEKLRENMDIQKVWSAIRFLHLSSSLSKEYVNIAEELRGYGKTMEAKLSKYKNAYNKAKLEIVRLRKAFSVEEERAELHSEVYHLLFCQFLSLCGLFHLILRHHLPLHCY